MDTITSYASSAIGFAHNIVKSADTAVDNMAHIAAKSIAHRPKLYAFLGGSAALTTYIFTTPNSFINSVAFYTLFCTVSCGLMTSLFKARAYSPPPQPAPQMDSERIVDISADSRGFSIHITPNQIDFAVVTQICHRMDQWLDQLGIERTEEFEPRNFDSSSGNHEDSNVRWTSFSLRNSTIFFHDIIDWSVNENDERFDYSAHWSRTRKTLRKLIQPYIHSLPLQFEENDSEASAFKNMLASELSSIRSILEGMAHRRLTRVAARTLESDLDSSIREKHSI